MLKDLGVRTSAWTRDTTTSNPSRKIARGVKPHIRRLGEPALTGPIRGKKPRRWVVERTNSWHNNFRALRIQIGENRGSSYGIGSPRLRSHHVSGGRSIMNGFSRLALF